MCTINPDINEFRLNYTIVTTPDLSGLQEKFISQPHYMSIIDWFLYPTSCHLQESRLKKQLLCQSQRQKKREAGKTMWCLLKHPLRNATFAHIPLGKIKHLAKSEVSKVEIYNSSFGRDPNRKG